MSEDIHIEVIDNPWLLVKVERSDPPSMRIYSGLPPSLAARMLREAADHIERDDSPEVTVWGDPTIKPRQ